MRYAHGVEIAVDRRARGLARGTRSLRHPAVIAGLALGLSCSVGSGVGYARGPLSVALCGINTSDWSLDPTFFGGDWSAGTYTIYLQESGAVAEYTNQLVFLVDDTEYVSRHLGERIPVGPSGAAPVKATLALDRACGRTAVTIFGQNVALEAYSGYIIFDAIYRGSSTNDAARLTTARAFAIALRDPRPAVDYGGDPDNTVPTPFSPSVGEMEGSFQFYYAAGRPAQRFP